MLIEVKNLEKIYGSANEYQTKALNGVSLAVQEGEFIGIMGASGSGKSTLLNILAAIDTPTAGQVKYEDQDITLLDKNALARFRKDKLGFVFQEYNLLDTLTIEENIILSLSLRNIPKSEIQQKVDWIAQALGIGDILKKFPYQVSGGQKQRCACARAVVVKPRLLLADEPTGALDSKAAHELLDTLAHINQEYDTTILMVTHDVFSASYCSRVLFVRDGKIYQELQRGQRSNDEMLPELLKLVSDREGGKINVD